MAVNAIPNNFGSGGSGLSPTADPVNNLRKILSDHATAINTLLAGSSGAIPDGVTITGAGTLGSPLVATAQFGSDTTLDLPNSSTTPVHAWEQIVSLSTNTPGSEVSQVVLKLLAAGAQAVQMTITPTSITLAPIIAGPTGSFASPTYGFSAEAGLGMLKSGTATIGFTCLANPAAQLSLAGLQLVQSNAALSFSSGGAQLALVGGSLVLTPQSTFYVAIGAARFQTAQGASVASAQPLALGTDGNYFVITGTTGIQGIVTTKWLTGTKIALQLPSGITITHNSGTPGASAVAILLRAAANLTTGATYVLELYYNGTNWIQPS